MISDNVLDSLNDRYVLWSADYTSGLLCYQTATSYRLYYETLEIIKTTTILGLSSHQHEIISRSAIQAIREHRRRPVLALISAMVSLFSIISMMVLGFTMLILNISDDTEDTDRDIIEMIIVFFQFMGVFLFSTVITVHYYYYRKAVIITQHRKVDLSHLTPLEFQELSTAL